MPLKDKVQTKFGVEHFREMFSIEIVSMTGALLAGVVLAIYKQSFEILPALFILFPGFLEMRGSISGSLSARLTSGLFLHVIKPELKMSKPIIGNVIASLVLTLITSVVLGLVAYYATSYFMGVTNFAIVYIAVMAGLISSAIEIPVTIAATILIFKKGHDPDDIVGPYITTLGDITSVFSLLVAMWVFL